MMSKDYLIEMAEYNKSSDATVASFLNKMTEAELTKDEGSYYKSPVGLFSHVIGGTAFFLGKMASALPSHHIKKFEVKDRSYAECAAIYAEIDDEMIQTVKNLSDDDMAATVDFFGHPVKVERMILKWFNTSVHHRGQISQIFDARKIEHDWSTGF